MRTLDDLRKWATEVVRKTVARGEPVIPVLLTYGTHPIIMPLGQLESAAEVCAVIPAILKELRAESYLTVYQADMLVLSGSEAIATRDAALAGKPFTRASQSERKVPIVCMIGYDTTGRRMFLNFPIDYDPLRLGEAIDRSDTDAIVGLGLGRNFLEPVT